LTAHAVRYSRRCDVRAFSRCPAGLLGIATPWQCAQVLAADYSSRMQGLGSVVADLNFDSKCGQQRVRAMLDTDPELRATKNSFDLDDERSPDSDISCDSSLPNTFTTIIKRAVSLLDAFEFVTLTCKSAMTLQCPQNMGRVYAKRRKGVRRVGSAMISRPQYYTKYCTNSDHTLLHFHKLLFLSCLRIGVLVFLEMNERKCPGQGVFPKNASSRLV
jgi:hypothetical protein